MTTTTQTIITTLDRLIYLAGLLEVRGLAMEAAAWAAFRRVEPARVPGPPGAATP